MNCSICLELIKDEYETLCKHKFCKSCISDWQKNNNTCPLCRKELIIHNHQKIYYTDLYAIYVNPNTTLINRNFIELIDILNYCFE